VPNDAVVSDKYLDPGNLIYARVAYVVAGSPTPMVSQNGNWSAIIYPVNEHITNLSYLHRDSYFLHLITGCAAGSCQYLAVKMAANSDVVSA
jgi:hypothetical protein